MGIKAKTCHCLQEHETHSKSSDYNLCIVSAGDSTKTMKIMLILPATNQLKDFENNKSIKNA